MSHRLLHWSVLSALLCASTAAAEPTATSLHPRLSTPKPAKAAARTVQTSRSTGVSKSKSTSLIAGSAAHGTSAKSAPAAASAPPPSAASTTAPSQASVRVPETAHVKVDVPAKLQALLDGDARMVPWLAATMTTIDGCHARDRGAFGTVAIALTLHENARPSADVGAVPAALRGVFTCAMVQLMQAERMPLFTGPEGQKHALTVRFVP